MFLCLICRVIVIESLLLINMSKNYYRQKMFRKLKQLKINIGDKCINNIEKNGRKENNNEINIDNTNNVNVIIY